MEGDEDGRRRRDSPSTPDVRIEYADTPPLGTPLVLVPPNSDGDDDELPTPEREPDPLPDEDRAPPRRAAAALPPRKRRSVVPEGPADDVTARGDGRFGDTGIEAPLFSPEWDRQDPGTPTWRPGAPPTQPRASLRNFWIVGAAALIGAALVVAWLAAYYAK